MNIEVINNLFNGFQAAELLSVVIQTPKRDITQAIAHLFARLVIGIDNMGTGVVFNGIVKDNLSVCAGLHIIGHFIF